MSYDEGIQSGPETGIRSPTHLAELVAAERSEACLLREEVARLRAENAELRAWKEKFSTMGADSGSNWWSKYVSGRK